MVDPTQYQYQHQYEAYHPRYEHAHLLEGAAQGEALEEQAHEKQAGLQGFPRGPTELSVLPNFGKHMACRL